VSAITLAAPLIVALALLCALALWLVGLAVAAVLIVFGRRLD